QPVSPGLLGIVLCGLMAAQVSAITADVNSVATLFTSDVYRSLRQRALSQRHILLVVRISSLVAGVMMLMVAYYLHDNGAGAVRANLTVVGILDMPLFVITIVYGLLWKRANWQGAVAGFLTGGTVGILTHFLIVPRYFNGYLRPALSAISTALADHAARLHGSLAPHEHAVRNVVPFISSFTALLVTPLVSLLTAPPQRDMNPLW